MKRKIVRIDEEKCNGCGLCVDACQEGALQLVNGKARLVSESYCDGLGNCLPECPAGAITIVEREAADFDKEAVKKQMEGPRAATPKEIPERLACGCPGTSVRIIEKENRSPGPGAHSPAGECGHNAPETVPLAESQLRQWPCQIKLVPVNAPFFDSARLLVAADCTAYAYAGLHHDFMRNKITIIGCPKLDNVDYAEKLTEILKAHEIKDITVLRMEVPCCGGIVNAVKQALINSGKMIPWRVVIIGTDGRIMEDL